MNEQSGKSEFISYVLVLSNTSHQKREVGALGSWSFAPGSYYYMGSARNGVRNRLERHLNNTDTRHWHIDYLRLEMEIEHAFVSGIPECELARCIHSLPNMEQPVPDFGASDCSCESHLARPTGDHDLSSWPVSGQFIHDLNAWIRNHE